MKPLVLLFPTFLKLMHFPLPQREKLLRRRFYDDGYDFYWSVKESVHNFALGHSSSEDCIKRFSKLSNDDEAKHNEYCFGVFYKWFRENPNSYIPPPKALYKSEQGFLHVRIEPEICVDFGNQKLALHFWNALEPDLEVQAAANAILLMRQTFLKQGFEKIRSGIFDGRKANIIWDDIIAEGTIALLPRELRATESIWIKLNQERTERRDPSHRPEKREGPLDRNPKGPHEPPR